MILVLSAVLLRLLDTVSLNTARNKRFIDVQIGKFTLQNKKIIYFTLKKDFV